MHQSSTILYFSLLKFCYASLSIKLIFVRLLTTYRALERLSQSEFNLDQLEAAATAAQTSHGATLLVPGTATRVSGTSLIGRKERNHALTVRDVERERGNQLSKYERNMMIFNWLHTLDDSAVADSVE